MDITVPGSMALSIRWELSSGLLRQGKLAGVWFPKKIPSVTAFSGQLGGIAFTMQRDKIYNTPGISSPRLFWWFTKVPALNTQPKEAPSLSITITSIGGPTVCSLSWKRIRR